MDPKDLKLIGKTAFPNYKGRTYRHEAGGSCTFMDLNWGGGTRSTFRAVRLADMKVDQGLGSAVPAPWANPFEGKTVEIPTGYAIVEHSIFCGKDLGLRVYTASVAALAEHQPAEVA